jgi:ribokinase
MNLSLNHQPKIIVVGSCSLDLVLDVDFIPSENTTVMAKSSEPFFGGKGANEAVAVARLGASSYLISCVGMDPNGQQIMRNLVTEEVNIAFVFEDDVQPTGRAYVASKDGVNSIIVVPSANYCLTTNQIDLADKFFHTCDLVLLQLEIPIHVVEHTILLAKKYKKKVGVYASPAMFLKKEIIDQLDFIVVKKNELKVVFGADYSDEILKKYPNKLFVREDDNSTAFFDGKEMQYQIVHQEGAKYKMGTGDAFIAGFSVALLHGNSTQDCVEFGNEVSLKVAQQRGAQNGLPYLKDFLK